jgi:hypothetical protein
VKRKRIDMRFDITRPRRTLVTLALVTTAAAVTLLGQPRNPSTSRLFSKSKTKDSSDRR